jgi:hypothetical protein
MTKDEALMLYMTAKTPEELIASAHALASVLNAKPPCAPKKRKNVRRGGTSCAYAGVKLPIFQRQACGHYFNSSGCAVCPHCPRIPARFVEGENYVPDVIARRNAMMGL